MTTEEPLTFDVGSEEEMFSLLVMTAMADGSNNMVETADKVVRRFVNETSGETLLTAVMTLAKVLEVLQHAGLHQAAAAGDPVAQQLLSEMEPDSPQVKGHVEHADPFAACL